MRANSSLIISQSDARPYIGVHVHVAAQKSLLGNCVLLVQDATNIPHSSMISLFIYFFYLFYCLHILNCDGFGTFFFGFSAPNGASCKICTQNQRKYHHKNINTHYKISLKKHRDTRCSVFTQKQQTILLIHRIKEIFVCFCHTQFIQYEFHCFQCTHWINDTT